MIDQKLIQLFSFLIVAFILVTCNEDEITTREYPRITTLEVDDISESGATFNAEIIHPGNQEIIEYGFVWGENENPTIESSEKRILSEKIAKGGFSAQITTTLKAGVHYFVRAYAKTREYLVYGKNVAFLSMGSNAPTIHSFEPLTGTIGDTVIISGEQFSFIKGQNTVTFDSLISEVIDASDTLLKVIVPTSLKNETSSLCVSILNNKDISENEFTLSSPTIALFNPEEGTDSTEVLIQGNGFSNLTEYNIVKFGDIRATVLEGNKNHLKVLVPSGIRQKEVEISVSVAKKETSAPSLFSMLPPVILGFNPKTAAIRETVTIEGNNFGKGFGANLVYFDTALAPIKKVSNAFIEVEVPYGVPINSTKIKIITAEQFAVSEDNFTLLAPEIALISPLKGTKNSELLITGYNFSPLAEDNLVQFNGIEALIINQSKEAISVIVPPDISQREVEIIVNTGGHPTSSVDFEYIGGNWSEGEAFPHFSRLGAAQFIIGTIAYLGLGEYSTKYNDMWSYDLNTGAWNQLSNFPGTARSFPVSFSMQGKGYVGLGTFDGTNLNDFWEYDPETDTWTEIQSFPGEGRYMATSFVINDIAYVGLGQTRFDTFDDFYKYDPVANQWITLSNFPGQPRSSAASFVLGDTAYVGLGGMAGYDSGDSQILNDFWKFLAISENWERLSDFPVQGRTKTSSFSIQDHGYVGMGARVDDHQIRRFDSFLEYDPGSDSWTETESNSFGEGDFATTFTYSGKAYLIFIQRTNQRASKQFEIFEPFF